MKKNRSLNRYKLRAFLKFQSIVSKMTEFVTNLLNVFSFEILLPSGRRRLRSRHRIIDCRLELLLLLPFRSRLNFLHFHFREFFRMFKARSGRPDFRLDPFHDGRNGPDVRLKLSSDSHQLLQIRAKA